MGGVVQFRRTTSARIGGGASLTSFGSHEQLRHGLGNRQTTAPKQMVTSCPTRHSTTDINLNQALGLIHSTSHTSAAHCLPQQDVPRWYCHGAPCWGPAGGVVPAGMPNKDKNAMDKIRNVGGSGTRSPPIIPLTQGSGSLCRGEHWEGTGRPSKIVQ